MTQQNNYLFTSDTHFGQERALELSRRPFKSTEEMDTIILNNINEKIEELGPDSGVVLIHLGDFGNHELVSKINCDVILVMGNYERKEAQKKGMDDEVYSKYLVKTYGYYDVYTEPITVSLFPKKISMSTPSVMVALSHEPLQGYNFALDKTHINFVLYGHIHGRHKVKHYGVDVGVDGSNYYPNTVDDVCFFLNAIEKGYYDKEVWHDDFAWHKTRR